mgnify:CR=1 FL=1
MLYNNIEKTLKKMLNLGNNLLIFSINSVTNKKALKLTTKKAKLLLRTEDSIAYIFFRSSNESITGTSHHSWVLCPKTTPIFLT